MQNMLRTAHQPSSGFIAGATGIATLLFGASGVFGELRDALNTICDVKVSGTGGWKGMAIHRLLSFGIVLGIGFLLLVSLVVSAAIATAAKFFSDMVPIHPAILEVINFGISFGMITRLFALMFKYVPDAKVDWRDTWTGATGDCLSVHHWQSVTRVLSGHCKCRLSLRRCRLPRGGNRVGLLFRANLPFWRGVHFCLCGGGSGNTKCASTPFAGSCCQQPAARPLTAALVLRDCQALSAFQNASERNRDSSKQAWLVDAGATNLRT